MNYLRLICLSFALLAFGRLEAAPPPLVAEPPALGAANCASAIGDLAPAPKPVRKSENYIRPTTLGKNLFDFLKLHDTRSPDIWFPGSPLRPTPETNEIQPEEAILASRLKDRGWTISNYESWLPNLGLSEKDLPLMQHWLRILYVRQLSDDFKKTPALAHHFPVPVRKEAHHRSFLFYKLSKSDQEIIRRYRAMGIDSSPQEFREVWKREDKAVRDSSAAKIGKVEATPDETSLALDLYKFFMAQDSGDRIDIAENKPSDWTIYFFPGQNARFRPLHHRVQEAKELKLANTLASKNWNIENYATTWRKFFAFDASRLQKMDEIMGFVTLTDPTERYIRRLEMGIRKQIRRDAPFRYPRPVGLFRNSKTRHDNTEAALEVQLRETAKLSIANVLSWAAKSVDPDVATALIWVGLSKIGRSRAMTDESTHERDLLEMFYLNGEKLESGRRAPEPSE